MREILFRGKREDTGDWIEGFYVRESNHAAFTSELKYKHFIVKDEFMDWGLGGLHSYKVIPETIGQYTGMTDKNGKSIFEGDIIRTQPFYDKPYSDKRKSKQFIGVVEWKTRKFNGNDVYPEQIFEAKWNVCFSEEFGKYVHSSWSDFWGCEVIGNIHDNPELLKGVINL